MSANTISKFSKTTWTPSVDPFSDRETKKYEHPIPSREFILDYFTEHQKLQDHKTLCTIFNLKNPRDQEALRRRLQAMTRDGQLMKSRNRYTLAKVTNVIIGHVIGHRDGFGFVEPEDGTSRIFISAYEMRQVFPGDRVAICIIDTDFNNRREGKIVRVLEHVLKTIVGRFLIRDTVGFIEPYDPSITQNVVIPSEERHLAKPGQVVVANIVSPPTLHNAAIGHITEILGDYLAPGLEVDTVIRSFNIPYQWPEEVLKEIQSLSEQSISRNLLGRKDIRDLPLVTIDNEDSRDFDDSVYCEKLKSGDWRLYVAIADVSHYVKPGTALDKAALERGNSVYFHNRVIPMLPEILSNNLCSLMPDEDRLCFTCEIIIDAHGKMKRYQFYPALMKSQARLTYTRVNELLLDPNAILSTREKELLPHLKGLFQLYKVLDAERQQRGHLNFETPEFKIEYDPNQKIKQLTPIAHNEIHRLIEVCMVAANVAAGQFLTKHKTPALYRVHDPPPTEKLLRLRNFLHELGLTLKGDDLPQPTDFAELLQEVKKREDAQLIQTMILRSQSQAFFSPDNDGHFGLAVDYYAYFTSPIRRYPDLLVHRAIRRILEKESVEFTPCPPLKQLGEHFTMTEQRADTATYEVLNFLKCEYMQKRVGEVFQGIITHVTGFGLFVELKDIYTEGLVHVSRLEDDHYLFEPLRHRLVGRRTGNIYRIGDSISVEVIRVSLEERLIDLNLVKRNKKKGIY